MIVASIPKPRVIALRPPELGFVEIPVNKKSTRSNVTPLKDGAPNSAVNRGAVLLSILKSSKLTFTNGPARRTRFVSMV